MFIPHECRAKNVRLFQNPAMFSIMRPILEILSFVDYMYVEQILTAIHLSWKLFLYNT